MAGLRFPISGDITNFESAMARARDVAAKAAFQMRYEFARTAIDIDNAFKRAKAMEDFAKKTKGVYDVAKQLERVMHLSSAFRLV